MKGNISCHLPSDSYRHNYEKTFGKSIEKAKEITGISCCAICGSTNNIEEGESVCLVCKDVEDIWGGGYDE